MAVGGIGSGWATEASLRAFEVSALTLDSERIDLRHLRLGAANFAVSVAELGSALSIPVWIENVSDETHHEAAIRLGCASGIGPLYGGPTLGDHLALTPRAGHPRPA